jgi:hypothetical protein
MPVTTYRYLIANLVTNEIIAELPFTGVSFTQQLNQAGNFQGHILIGGINTAEFNIDAATIPMKNAIYVDRNGVLVWGGVIWGRSYNSTEQQLSIQAREFISYFERRRIIETVDYFEEDQLVIASDIIIAAQAVPNGDIGLLLNTRGETTSGILVDRVYYDYELKPVFGAIQDLSRQLEGFDFRVDVYYDEITGLPVKAFNTYFPRSGDPLNIPVWLFPAGNTVEYEYPEDGATAANTIYALGAGSNEGKMIAIGQDAAKFAEGWALLEDSANYSDIDDDVVLQQLADGQVLAVAYPPTTLKLVVPPFVDPEFGTYEIGDDARIIIRDVRFPTGLDELYRIVGLTVEPGEDGPERVTLTLTQGTGA